MSACAGKTRLIVARSYVCCLKRLGHYDIVTRIAYRTPIVYTPCWHYTVANLYARCRERRQ
jgi:hypothetical protein